MRMWNVETSQMCDKHLLGEHVEMHMFVGTINQGKSINGYVNNGLVEVDNLRKRHDKISREMRKRGMNHASPLPDYKKIQIGNVNIKKNEIELKRRCKNCFR